MERQTPASDCGYFSKVGKWDQGSCLKEFSIVVYYMLLIFKKSEVDRTKC